MEVNYLYESLLPGKIGHLLVITAFIAALFSAICYFFSENNTEDPIKQSWKKLARISFFINLASIIGIVSVLFYLILNHKFEYHYVWAHSSLELPIRYILSCFWEGQEGSFLLWTFWHAILGIIVILTAKKYEAPVMFVLCITQFYLASMILGIHIFEYKIGSSPFILLRDFMGNAPIFQRADYLDFVKDGNGLNPLLQNYWMTIHPPTLFLGFASTLLPFAYVIAALWQKDYSKTWTLHTLTWALFSGGILGIGILMGAAWAYESLTFGGFWAWDPVVENASLVPWLTLVAAIHTLVIYRSTGYSLKITQIFFILSFILILYSTFLTRSGVLGDTSVHAFTDLGMNGQLLIYIFLFAIPSIILFMVRYSSIPTKEKEEKVYSREFWMFIGSILIFLLSIMIIYDTSLPVINKIFGSNATITDAIAHYNRYALWFAVIIIFLAGATLYLRYKKDKPTRWFKDIIISLLVSLVLTITFVYISGIGKYVYWVLMFAGFFGLVANFNFIFNVIKGKYKVSGAAVAHLGFALILLGILFSAGNKEVISINRSGIDFGEAFDEQNKRQNVLLRKDLPVKMSDYEITYLGDSVSGPDIFYKVQYQKKKDNKTIENFILTPNAQINPKMGLIANPDTRHYLLKDIYTHVTQVPKKDIDPSELKTEMHNFKLAKGDSSASTSFSIKLKDYVINPISTEYIPEDGDVAVAAALEFSNGIKKFLAEPIYYIRNNRVFSIPAYVADLGLSINFNKIETTTGTANIEIVEQEQAPQYIIMKAIVFPLINILWIGCLLMGLGFFISMFKRIDELKRDNRKQGSS